MDRRQHAAGLVDLSGVVDREQITLHDRKHAHEEPPARQRQPRPQPPPPVVAGLDQQPAVSRRDGRGHRHLLAADVAVLVPRNHQLVAPLRREIRALRALDTVGLPGAPRLLDVIDDTAISSYPLAVVERVAGTSLEAAEPALSERGWQHALRGAGAAQGHVHQRARGDPGDRPPAAHRAVLHGLLDPDPACRIDAIDTVAPEVGATRRNARALADRLSPAAAIPHVVVHNDLHEAQVMIGPAGVTGLIDWQTASIAHPFVDFDILQWGHGALARLTAGTTDHRQAMWDGYTADRDHGDGTGDVLDLAWSLNDGWWDPTRSTAPVTDFPLADTLRRHLVDRARGILTRAPGSPRGPVAFGR